MKVELKDGRIFYQSQRAGARNQEALTVTYAACSDLLPWQSPSTSLDRFLCERYCLYAAKARHLYRAHIHHAPWPIQNASADFQLNTMTTAPHLPRPLSPALLHFSRMIDVLVWAPERIV